MKKNIIYWIGIENPQHTDKYGGFEYFEYSKNTWKHFCEKYECEFVEFNVPVKDDLIEYRVNWQKILYVFDELERKGINYDQIALVDSTCMVKWDCPNFFELTEGKFVGWRDLDNMRWIKESIDGYSELFNYELDGTKYINSGFIIFNSLHRKLINDFKKFYESNKTALIDLQDNKIKKGNEQTPLNYWLQKHNVDVKIDLPLPFKLTHLNRKELFSYNWQLKEDNTPFFIKYGWNWIFNGIPKDQRTQLMKKVWDMVKHNYIQKSNDILDTVNHKDTSKNSTSRKFKQNIIDYFGDKDINLAVEFGCCHGDTTKILGSVSKKVLASDIADSNIELSKLKCKGCNNISFEVKDVNSIWEYNTPDVIYMDALHDYNGMSECVLRIKQQYPSSIVIMDDYGHKMNTIKPIIDKLISNNEIEVLQWIGEDAGYVTANGKSFIDKEGLIFKFKEII